jgi:transcriptional regulator with XRE-family HTH domain
MPRQPLGNDPRLRRLVRHEADHLLRLEARAQGETFREQRLRLEITQADVARAVGTSRSVVSAIEHGDPSVSPKTRFRVAEVLGLRLRLPAYPDGTPRLYDRNHSLIIEHLLALCHPRWQVTVEASVPGPGHRSTDVRLECGIDIVLSEIETRLRRWEQIVRESHEKVHAVAEEVGPDRRVHALLVLPPTRHNRELIRSLAGSVAAAFPADEQAIRRALTGAEEPWPGDGLLWLGPFRGARPTSG